MTFIGMDLVEITRIRRSMRNERFLSHILGAQEFEQLQDKKFPAQSVAANFCAKEAFLKSIGQGLGFLKLRDIEVLREPSGKPYLKLNDKALAYAKAKNLEFAVSITHTKRYASAVVLAEEVID